MISVRPTLTAVLKVGVAFERNVATKLLDVEERR